MEQLWDGIRSVLGIQQEVLDLAWWQIGLRAFLVYVAALAMVRVGEKRFLGKSTAFDVILGIMIGSVVSRAINSGAPFFETLLAGGVLVGLHYVFAIIAFRSDHLGDILKGNPRVLIRDGEIQWNAMRKSHIGEKDLIGALRTNAELDDPQKVKLAHLERSGDISVIPQDKTPKVVHIDVRDGVQTVRIELT